LPHLVELVSCEIAAQKLCICGPTLEHIYNVPSQLTLLQYWASSGAVLGL